MAVSYWVYSRIGVNVWASDQDVEDALEEWAKRTLKPGVRVTTDLTRKVLKHHHDARRLCEEWRM